MPEKARFRMQNRAYVTITNDAIGMAGDLQVTESEL